MHDQQQPNTTLADLLKSADGTGKMVISIMLRRAGSEQLPRCQVGMEACAISGSAIGDGVAEGERR
jgi:hypothetical protein